MHLSTMANIIGVTSESVVKVVDLNLVAVLNLTRATGAIFSTFALNMNSTQSAQCSIDRTKDGHAMAKMTHFHSFQH